MTHIPFFNYRNAILKSDLDSECKLILFCLDNHADNTTRGWSISVAQISQETSLHRTTIHKRFSVLEESGFLTIERRFKDNEKIASTYWLTLPDKYVLKYERRGVDGSSSERQGSSSQLQGYSSERHRTIPSTKPITKEKIYKKVAQEEEAMKEEFEEIWDSIPNHKRKKSKRLTGDSYIKARRYVDHETIKMVIKPKIAEWESARGTNDWNYIQDPTVWFNQTTWNDPKEVSRLLSLSSPKQSFKKQEEGSTPRNFNSENKERVMDEIKANATVKAEFLKSHPLSMFARKVREYVNNCPDAMTLKADGFLSYTNKKGS